MPKQSPSSTQWSLADLYNGLNDTQIKTDFASATTLVEQLKTYRGKIAQLSPKEILNLVTTWEDLAFLLHKIGLFAGLTESTNVNVAQVTRFSKKIDEQIIALGKEIIFIDVELSKLNNKKWDELLTSKDIAPYKNFLGEIRKQAQHLLSEPEERILADKSQTSWQALNHIFEITTDTLSFPWDDTTITLEELMTKFHDPDAAVRKKAAHILHEGMKVNDKTTPAVYNALVQDKQISDTLRHFSYPEQSRFMGDEVEKPTVEAMVSAVNQSFSLIDDYYTLKKKILKTDTLYWWDRYAPLPEIKTTIEADEAKTMVIDAYREFSPKMAEITENMFTKQHVDWFPSPTKRGGAFCAMSGKNLYPYVLLNHTNTPRDVMTLAHELGHAIHDVLAQEKNVFFQTHPSLALAEIASTFGEFLLFEKLIQSNISKEDKTALLMSFIEDSFATVYRQATMFQFEQAIHTTRAKEGELSKEQIDTLWHEIMSKPFAKSLTYTDEHKNTWMYVGHIFRSPFYVYSYAFAKLCVLSLIAQYKEKGRDFVPTYITLLQSGGSLSPKDNLKQAGLDIDNPEFWQQGFSLIEKYIKELIVVQNS